jgi:tetratricopeptide (TPR) repeat protein
MATNRTDIVTAFIWIAAAMMAAAGDIRRAGNFVDGCRAAKETSAPHLVLVHGSPWQPLSTRLMEIAWDTPELAKSLTAPAVLTAIAVPHDSDEEETKAFNQSHKGWDPRSYTTLPALQLYAADGHLLLVRQGRALRDLATPRELTTFLNETLSHAATRRVLLAALDAAEAGGDNTRALDLLDQLFKLPLNADPDSRARLARQDPHDTLGWQARLNFKPWNTHLREVVASIKEGKAAEVIEDMDHRLAARSVPPSQQALLLGSKAMALAELGQLSAAWGCFEEALAAAPEDPLARALHRHGQRIAALPLRELFPPESALQGRKVGRNLTRDHATFTLSSADHDDPAHHASLFRGAYAPTGFAFHTAAENNAHIIVDLHGNCTLQALRIVNRESNLERAATLTLWTSTDGMTWQNQWRSEAPAPAWDILLDPPVPAGFLKIGLDSATPEHLHLRAVDAFGERR